MVTQPFWINSQLAIVPRPRGGDWLDDEMKAMREAGIDVVVSMLEDEEAVELGLEREDAAAKSAGVKFLSFPIHDRSLPTSCEQFEGFLSELENEIENKKHIGIHCRACIGRSSVVAASLLIRSGVKAEEAWRQIEAARGFPVPDTSDQRTWVDRNIKA